MSKQQMILALLPSTLLPATLLMQVTMAQEPAPATTPPARAPKTAQETAPNARNELELMSLRAFLGERIHTAAAGGQGAMKVAAKPVATVHDAIVGSTGELQTILVVSETPVAGTPAERGIAEVQYHELAAKDLRWNARQQRFETSLDAAAIAALPRHQPARGEDAAADGAIVSGNALASRLLVCKPKTSDHAAGDLGSVVRIWFAPARLQLAFLGLESGGLRVVPWQLVRLDPMQKDGGVGLNATRQEITGAPKLASGTAPLDAATRARAYEHFKLQPPAWDAAAGAAEADKAGKPQPAAHGKSPPESAGTGKEP